MRNKWTRVNRSFSVQCFWRVSCFKTSAFNTNKGFNNFIAEKMLKVAISPLSIYVRTSLKSEESLTTNAFTNAFKNLSNSDNHFKIRMLRNYRIRILQFLPKIEIIVINGVVCSLYMRWISHRKRSEKKHGKRIWLPNKNHTDIYGNKEVRWIVLLA